MQAAFSAGTIYLLGAVQAATGLRVAQESLKHSLSQAQLCVQYLLHIGTSWHCANSIAEILRNLLQQQLKPLLDRRSIPQAGQLVFTPTATPATGVTMTTAGTTTGITTTGNNTMTSFSLNPPQRRQRSSSRKPSRSRSSDSGHTALSMQSKQQQQVHPLQIVAPHQPMASSSSSSSTALTFDNPWPNFDFSPTPGTPVTGPLSCTSSPDGQQMQFPFGQHPGGTDFSPGYLAMLGGEPLSNAPFLPTFSKLDYSSTNHAENISGFGNFSVAVQMSNDGTNAEPSVGIPDSELAVLEQFWNQYFR